MRHLIVFLALRYLRSKKIVLLSIAAVGMSCALLISVASLFTAFIAAFEAAKAEHMGDVMIVPYRGPVAEVDDLVRTLEADPAIHAASGVLEAQGLLLIGQGNVRAAQIWGIDLAGRCRMSRFGEFLLHQSASIEPTFGAPDVEPLGGGFVGIGLLASPDEQTDEYDREAVLREYLGRRAMLTTGRAEREPLEGTAGGVRFKRRTVKFTITDVVFTGLDDFDRHYVYVPLEVLSETLHPGRGPVADSIQVRLADGLSQEQGREVVRRLWMQWAAGRDPWAAQAVIRTAREHQAALAVEYKKQMWMLMLIFGVVSAGAILLIFCIFYLIVLTKQKDIAIVKSYGLGSWGVAGLYVVFGLVIGLAGAGLGVVLGWAVTHNVNTIEHWISVVFGLKLWKSSTYMFSQIPNQVNASAVLWVSVAAVLAAAAGALIPAVAAARVQPIRILRYE